MPAVGHPENMSLQEVHNLVQGEMQRIQDEMNEAQIARFDLLLRVQMIERYMHWFVRSSRTSGRNASRRR